VNSYALTASDFILGHTDQSVGLLNDLSEKPTPLDIESLVASGDMFAVLATELDSVALSLNDTPIPDVSPKLDKLTEILLYLQQHYQISHKSN